MYRALYAAIHDYQADVAMCGFRLVEDEQIRIIHGSRQLILYDNKQAMAELIRDLKINNFAWDKAV